MINQFACKYSVASLILVLLSACGGQDTGNNPTIVNADTASSSVSNTSQTVATNQSTTASTEASLNAQISGGEITIKNFIGVYETRIFYSVFPKVATQNVKTDFVVEGVNIPADARLAFDSLACDAPTNRTETTFNQKCTMGNGTSAMGRLFLPSKNKLLGERSIQLIPAVVEPLYAGNLPDTGITSAQCFGAGSNTLISCTNAAAIALNPKQDGMVGRDVTAPAAADGVLGFSYSNVPKATGGVYAKTECVKDNITGLVWEGKTPDNGLRGIYRGYTNFTSTVNAVMWNGGAYVNPTLADIGSETNTIGYKNYVNSIALCGYTDWRLPEINELTGIYNNGSFSDLDTDWFPNLSGLQSFWSGTGATAYATTATIEGNSIDWIRAWSTNSLGTSRNLRENQLPVKLVRGNIPNPSGRYSYTNGGTEVVDSQTGLIWKRCAEGSTWSGSACVGIASQLTHENALLHANTQTGWRLPNKTELISILDHNSSYLNINTVVYPLSYYGSTPVPFLDSNANYWSSSPSRSGYPFLVSVNGHIVVDYGSSPNQVRLVRNVP